MDLHEPIIKGPASSDNSYTGTAFIKTDSSDSYFLLGGGGHALLSSKESDLGNPSVSGYVLSSTTAGVRSWVAQSGGSGITLTSLSATAPILYNNTTGVFSHSTGDGYNHIPTGGAAGQFLKYSSSGVAIWAADNNTIYTHPAYTTRSITATGAQVLSTFTSDAIGSVTGITVRTLTLANLGYTGATDANNYVHPTGDGNLHVPATGTTNNGKVLTAGATAGSLSWVTPSTGGTGTIDQVLAAGNTAVSKQLIFTQSGYTTTINSTSYKLVADSINYGIELDNNGIIFTMNTATQNYSSIVSESVSVSGKLPLLGFIAPGSASATGVQGEIRITSTYVYFCIGLNSWVRGAMSSW